MQFGPAAFATATQALTTYNRPARTATVGKKILAVDVLDREVSPCDLQRRRRILWQVDIVQFPRGTTALFA